MRSLTELGIGLSVVFAVFFLALIAELYYIWYWKSGAGTITKSMSFDCAKGVTSSGKKLPSSTTEFAHEASLVGSFGGYHANIPTEFSSRAEISATGESFRSSTEQGLHLLFPIREETKDEMELAAAAGPECPTKLNCRLRSRTPSDVLNIHFTSGSSSPAASDAFTTPPVSPQAGGVEAMPTAPKLSPYAACAVRSLSGGRQLAPMCPPPEVEMQMGGLTSSRGCLRSGRTPLQLLFARSPLLGVLPQSPIGRPPMAMRVADVENMEASPSPRFQYRLSLASLFRQSATPACSK